MINIKGDRFVDEGLDLRNYTYAKFGRAILQQPERTAFQLFDQRTIPWLRQEEYREERVQRVVADTIPDLAEKLSSLGLEDAKAFIDTIDTYNKAVYTFQEENNDRRWDPSVLDGCSTQSNSLKLPLPKSNWGASNGPRAFRGCSGDLWDHFHFRWTCREPSQRSGALLKNAQRDTVTLRLRRDYGRSLL